jgi:hypothetical protein
MTTLVFGMVACGGAAQPRGSDAPTNATGATSATSATSGEVTAAPTVTGVPYSSASAAPPQPTPKRVDVYAGPFPPPLDAPCATPTADATAAARETFAEGTNRYQRGDYAVAAADFEQAYRIACNAHVVLYNLGKAHEAADQRSAAIARTRRSWIVRARPPIGRTR